MRNGNFDVVLAGNCQSVVNPLLDVQRYLPTYAANYGRTWRRYGSTSSFATEATSFCALAPLAGRRLA
jgi:hypothetical protein